MAVLIYGRFEAGLFNPDVSITSLLKGFQSGSSSSTSAGYRFEIKHAYDCLMARSFIDGSLLSRGRTISFCCQQSTVSTAQLGTSKDSAVSDG